MSHALPEECPASFVSQNAAHLALLVSYQNVQLESPKYFPKTNLSATGNASDSGSCTCYVGYDDGCPGWFTTCSQWSSCQGGGGSSDGVCKFLAIF